MHGMLPDILPDTVQRHDVDKKFFAVFRLIKGILRNLFHLPAFVGGQR